MFVAALIYAAAAPNEQRLRRRGALDGTVRQRFDLDTLRPVIARIWKGVVRRQDSDAYADYIRDTGFNEYSATAGNLGAWMLRRDQAERTEFITFSLWASVDAIRSFAGDDIDAAVYYPEDERYLVERDATVSHYDVVDYAPPRADA